MNSEQNSRKDEIVSCNPLVSVIIPAYNAEQFIEPTLHSVISQTYKNLEVIVVDDGSCDRTAEIVRKFAQQDDRIRLIQQTNKGVVAARNLAIHTAQGELIAPLDADDIWLPQNLERQVDCLVRSDPEVGLCYAWSADIDEYDRPTGEFHAFTIGGQVYTTLLCHDFIGNASSSLIRRSCFEKVDGYYSQEELPQGCEDWELYLRIAEQYQFCFVPEFLIGYRKHSQNMSFDGRAMAEFRNSVWQSIKQKYPKLPTTLYRLSNSSFYLYLARQSSLYDYPLNTLFWLYQMLRMDCVTPFLRLGVYLLTIKSFLSVIRQSVSHPIGNPQAKIRDKQTLQVKHQLTSIAALNDRRLAIKFKVFVGNVLHHWMPILFGTPQTWQKNVPVTYEHSSIGS